MLTRPTLAYIAMEDSQHRLPRRVNVSGYKAEGEFPTSLRVKLHYLPPQMLDVKGVRETPCHLMRLLDSPDDFKPPRTKSPTDKPLVIYIAFYKLNVDASFYARDRFNYPLVLDYRHDFTKRTSKRCTTRMMELTSAEKLNLAETNAVGGPSGVNCGTLEGAVGVGKPLAQATWMAVHVDPVTRKSKPFPEWYKLKYNIPSTGRPIDVQFPEKPLANVSNEHTVRFTETDVNEHTNYASYVHICLDAFYDNIVHNNYPNGFRVFLNGWMKEVVIEFKNESNMGDVLIIESWQDVKCHNRFYFEICSKDKLVARLSFQFYSSLVENSHL